MACSRGSRKKSVPVVVFLDRVDEQSFQSQSSSRRSLSIRAQEMKADDLHKRLRP